MCCLLSKHRAKNLYLKLYRIIGLEYEGLRIMCLLRLSLITLLNALHFISGITTKSSAVCTWSMIAVLCRTKLCVLLGATLGNLIDSSTIGDNKNKNKKHAY